MPLPEPAAGRPHGVELLARLETLGDHVDADTAADPHDHVGRGAREGIAAGRRPGEERSTDLYHVDGYAAQVGERLGALAELVEGGPHAHRAQRTEVARKT